MKNFKIYLKAWNHILANIVTTQVGNAIRKNVNIDSTGFVEKSAGV